MTEDRTRKVLRSHTVRHWAGLLAALLAAAYLIAIPVGAIPVDRRLGTVEIVLLAVILLYSSPLPDRLLDITFEKGGVSARFRELEERQDRQASDIRVLQFLLEGIVPELELEKLRGLNSDKPFMVRYHQEMYFEIQRLDAKRFVRPRLGHGVNSIHNHVNDPDLFDLKTYIEITDRGREYLALYDEKMKAGRS